MAPQGERQEEQTTTHLRSATHLADFLLSRQGEEMSGRKGELLQLWLARRGLSLEALEDMSEDDGANREGPLLIAPSAQREWRDPTESARGGSGAASAGVPESGTA